MKKNYGISRRKALIGTILAFPIMKYSLKGNDSITKTVLSKHLYLVDGWVLTKKDILKIQNDY